MAGVLCHKTRTAACREKSQIIMHENAMFGKETILWEGYAAWSQFIWLYLIVAMMMVRAALLVRSGASGWGGWLVGAVTLLGTAAALRRWGRYVVTSRRVVLRNGWTGRDIQSIEHQEIREVSIKQGPLADLMGIGTVVIQSRQDDAVIQFRGLLDPEDVTQRIQAALVRRPV
ncbi:PH domain-containing protein [Nitrospira defluvii]|nr:PH domain-containing protein [Nitrospira defluvii]